MPFDFSQHQEVDSLSDVPENFDSFYEEKADGSGFVLNTENKAVAAAVKIISGQTAALGRARKEADQARGNTVDLSPLKDYGSTPEEIAKAFDEKLKASGKKTSTDEQEVENRINTVKTNLKNQYETQLGEAKSLLESRTAQLHEQVKRQGALAAIAEHEGSPKLLTNLVLSQTVVEEDDNGNFMVVVPDGNGGIRYNGSGAPMTPSDLVAEMRKDKDLHGAFSSSIPDGGGTPPGTTSRRFTSQGKDPSKMTAHEKAKLGMERRATRR